MTDQSTESVERLSRPAPTDVQDVLTENLTTDTSTSETSVTRPRVQTGRQFGRDRRRSATAPTPLRDRAGLIRQARAEADTPAEKPKPDPERMKQARAEVDGVRTEAVDA